MNKKAILKTILGVAEAIDPRIGLVERGLTRLIHRDNDPTNDVDETASALTDIVLNAVAEIEDLTGNDVVDNEALAQVAENIKRDIVLYVTLFKAMKPKKAVS